MRATKRGVDCAIFPPGIESHSTVQDFYFGADNLLRRHDYHVDVAGGSAGAQYVYAMIESDGIVLPSKRLMYQRGADHRAILNPLVVLIDVAGAAAVPRPPRVTPPARRHRDGPGGRRTSPRKARPGRWRGQVRRRSAPAA